MLSLLVYDAVRTRPALAHDLSLRSPLVFYRLLELDDTSARQPSIMARRVRPAARPCRTSIGDSRRGAHRTQPLAPLLHAAVREAKLLEAVPALVDLDDVTGPGSEVPAAVGQLAALWSGPIAVTLSGDKLPPLRMRPVVHIQVPSPGLATRIQLWQRALPEIDPATAGELAERFAVTGGVIEMAARAAGVAGGADLESLALAVRSQLYGRLSRLGTPLDTPFAFDDIVADSDTRAMLREVVAAIRERRRVREDWGSVAPPGSRSCSRARPASARR
jgi:hypothetical protein